MSGCRKIDRARLVALVGDILATAARKIAAGDLTDRERRTLLAAGILREVSEEKPHPAGAAAEKSGNHGNQMQNQGRSADLHA